MVARQSSRVGDASYLEPGQWQWGMNFRSLDSRRHFKGKEQQVEREELNTYVINRQNIWDLSASYAVTRRLNLTASVPFINGSWELPIPVRPTPGPREGQHSHGMGDITLGGRWWVRDPLHAKGSNVALGVGLKMPTGKADYKNVFPDINGNNRTEKPVDVSIQPGDGGWGLSLSADGFRTAGKTTWFASAVYLVNPRDTNGVPSIRSALGLPPDPVTPSTQVNSVPDQYLYRVGASYRVSGQVSAALSFRAEGVPSTDLIGRSNGFRRPGYALSIEPGLTYARGDSTWTLNVPVTISRNRRPTEADGVTRPGDATFADYVVLLGYSQRVGAR
uniref:Uncharacterized protein n=1 Tax=uncultured Armatimonadetes bacterium TaxID=157466 RepID=A0A6J4II34_9BACT|nr:hypothetical protein AVDCRST_MAG63-1914 [uncultured Armatimonadetes bacterium]